MAMISEEEVTILIPTLATDFTKRALRLCLKSLDDFKGRIIVAINGDEPIPLTDADQDWRPVDWIKVDAQGQCKAVNDAASLANTPWLLIMNDDMIVAPDSIQKLLWAVDNFGLLVASPNLVEPKKGAAPFIEQFCGGIGTEGTKPDFNEAKWLEFAANYKEHPNPRLGLEPGFNLPFMIRKDVWDTIGGYDEAYDPWGSCGDTDLQTRILLAGITPKRFRGSLVYHFGSTSGTFNADKESFRHANWRYYEDKFGFPSFKNPLVWYKPEIPDYMLKFHPDYRNKYGS